MSLDAMKQAQEALEEAVFYTSSESWPPSMTRECEAAITALRAAIEQAQEPVAWLVQYPNKHEFVWGERPQWIAGAIGIEPLYTAPRQWQGLTDEELNQIYAEPQTHAGQYARAIEARLKEKNV
jgi:hypothetical protein